MQLTKDDVEIYAHDGAYEEHINIKKLKQVIEFYYRYKITEGKSLFPKHFFQDGYDRLCKEKPDIINLFKKTKIKSKMGYNDWLFSYCFKERLK